MRYSVRGYQNKMLGQAIPQRGVRLYSYYPDLLRLQWRGLNTLFDWLALCEIKAARY